MALSHSPAEIVAALLMAKNLGTDADASPLGQWPVYITQEPTTPDEVITVFDTVGAEGGRSMVDGEQQGAYGFQVRIRSKRHSAGWQKSDSIRETLAKEVWNVAVGIGTPPDDVTYNVQAIVNIGDVLPLGTEQPTSKRRLFTLNAMLVVQEE